MKTIKVMIVEDDFMVARVNRKFTEAVEGFEVVHVALNGLAALSFIEDNRVDLIVLDVYLPDLSGVDLIKQIRAGDYPVDFILITAAHDQDTVSNSIRFGVFDYIIKPFEFGRYEESLLRYRRISSAMGTSTDFDQDAVNELLTGKASREDGSPLPKGINEQTLQLVKDAIASLQSPFTLDDAVSGLSFSRITARRYLDYLVEAGRLVKSFEYQKVGRPSLLYVKKEKTGNETP
ncbi:MAG: response regulator [Syntrophales bacterium]